MAAALENIRYLQLGAHASGAPADADDFPGTLVHVIPEGQVSLDFGGYAALERPRRPDGGPQPSLQGPQKLDGIPDLAFELRGLSGSGAGDGTSTSTLSHDLDALLEGVTGSAAADVEGDDLAASPGSGSTVIFGASTSYAVGDAILIPTSEGYLARVITDIAGDPSLTVDRALKGRDGTAATPTNSGEVLGMRTYACDPTNGDHVPWGWDAEGSQLRRRAFGVLGNFGLQFPAGGRALIGVSGQRALKWDDGGGLASPTYSAPTRGSVIQVADTLFMIGDTVYQAFDFAFDGGNELQPRVSSAGEEGSWGSVVTAKSPTLTCKIRMGTDSAPTALTDSALETLLADDDGGDLSLQVGRSVGATALLRAAAARLMPDVKRTLHNGKYVAECTFQLTGATPYTLSFA